MMSPKKYFLFTICAALLFSISLPAYAATVKAAKGKKILVNADGDELKKGQVFFVLRNGKKVGIIKISAVKGSSGLAVLGKGKAAKGDELQLRDQKKKKKSEEPTEVAAKESSPAGPNMLKDKAYWGLLFGYSMNAATVENSNTSTKVDIDGSGFSAKAAFDFPLFSVMSFRGMSGIEQFNAAGGASCSGECSVEIMYLTFDFWGRLKFSEASNFWVGAGFDLLFPLSKSSNVITESSITNTTLMALGFGYDMPLSPTSYLPIAFEYGLYPSSDNVEATAMMLRVGYMTKF